MPLFISVGFLGLVSNGLGLVILVLIFVLRSWSCLHHCQTPSWWGLLPLARIPPRSRPSASIFGPSGLIRQPVPTVFSSPNAYINTVSAHFQSQRMHQNAEFCIKNIKKTEVATPGPPRRKGRHLFALTPVPPARCWCPSASSRLATSLGLMRPAITDDYEEDKLATFHVQVCKAVV